MAKTFKLVAVSGDMSANGMGNTNKVITLTQSQAKVAQQWIDLQNRFTQRFPSLLKQQIESGVLNEELTELTKKDTELTGKMFDAGIFQHKWDARTSWTIA
jgi:hypothetical protein